MKAKVVGREFVVARCEPTTALYPIDEPFDRVARDTLLAPYNRSGGSSAWSLSG